MQTHILFHSPHHDNEVVHHFEIARKEHFRSRLLINSVGVALFVAAVIASAIIGECRIDNLIHGLPGIFNYINATLPRIEPHSVIRDIEEWYWGIPMWLGLLGDTIVIAFLGTFLGIIGALFICFASSKNLTNNMFIYFISRRVMEFARAVPELVYAMIFVFSFGLGPCAGVLAIAIHSAGSLGKLFSEVNENIDMNPLEGVKASGADWIQIIRYGVLPQVLPNFISYSLLRFEINIRAASIIGFVGAGGIGQELMFVIRQFVYTDISAIVLMIIGTVSVIDILCERIRHFFINKMDLL